MQYTIFMKKKSFEVFIITSLFIVANIATSKFNTSYRVGDSFGFPFVFFTAHNNFEFIEDTTFKIQYLLLDFMILSFPGILLSRLLINMKRIGK